MGGWRIEPARTGRSTCRVCNRVIQEGEVRFGQDEVTATWYHLGCAAKGKPRAFKPFAAKAAEIAKQGWKQSGPKSASKKAPRNPELEAALVQAPRDEQRRLVYADWLQSRSDPWGEIIALACAGKGKEASKLLRVHQADLTAGQSSHKEATFFWTRGFISWIAFEPKKQERAVPLLEELLSLRAAVVLDELSLELQLNREVVELVSARSPRSLRKLNLTLGEGLGALAHPGLEALSVCIDDETCLSELAGLSGKRLPALRRLDVLSATDSSRAVMQAVVDSPVLKTLQVLDVGSNLEDFGVEVMLENAKALAHIPAIWFDSRDPRWKKEVLTAFGRQQKAYLAIDPEERDLD
jgi:uncharacterized protein (TIGR02996 family)